MKGGEGEKVENEEDEKELRIREVGCDMLPESVTDYSIGYCLSHPYNLCILIIHN